MVRVRRAEQPPPVQTVLFPVRGKIFTVVELQRREIRRLGQAAQNADNPVRGPVDVRRKRRAAERQRQRRPLGQREPGRGDQQIGLLAQHAVPGVHVKLIAEHGGTVFDRQPRLPHRRVKGRRGLERREQADQMDLLRRGQLHPRHADDAVLPAGLQKRAAVAAGIVVGQRRELQPAQRRHARDVRRAHVVVRAGRQTGVDVQIVAVAAHSSAATFAPIAKEESPVE